MLKKSMETYKISTIVLSLIAVLFFCTTIYYKTHPQIEYETVTKYDTTYVHTFDTITVTKSDIVYKNTIVLDTVYLRDTIKLIEQKIYEDSLSTIFFHGIDCDLDSIEYRIPTDTVKLTIDNTVYVQAKDNFWKNRFTISAGIFFGYGLIHRQPDAFVGIGGAIRLY